MKFDLFALMQKRDEAWSASDVFDDLTDQVKLAEESSFETVWFAEHHFSNYSLCPSPLMAVAYFAGLTRRVRLGTAVVVLPLYEPMRLVQEIGMADVLSGGRLVLGVGSGYQDYEFQRFRTPLEEGVDRSLEILDLIELAIHQDKFDYQGAYYQYPSTQIAIKPLRTPEIWVAGLGGHPKVQKRMAESGYVPMLTPSWKPMGSIAQVRDAHRVLCEEAGRDGANAPFGLMRFVHITDDRSEAIEAAERARYSSRVSLSMRLNYSQLDGIYAADLPAADEPPIEEMVENYIIGSVEHCIEKILEDHEVMGHSHVLVNPQLGGVPRERVMRTLELMASDVIPEVQKELSCRGAEDPVINQRPMIATGKVA